jgi:hypothetical protein
MQYSVKITHAGNSVERWSSLTLTQRGRMLARPRTNSSTSTSAVGPLGPLKTESTRAWREGRAGAGLDPSIRAIERCAVGVLADLVAERRLQSVKEGAELRPLHPDATTGFLQDRRQRGSSTGGPAPRA